MGVEVVAAVAYRESSSSQSANQPIMETDQHSSLDQAMNSRRTVAEAIEGRGAGRQGGREARRQARK